MMKNDPELHDLLKEWTVEPKISGDMRAEVWRQIAEREEASFSWKNIWNDLTSFLFTPRAATSFCLALILISGIYGYRKGEQDNRLQLAGLEHNYVHSISPFVADTMGSNR